MLRYSFFGYALAVAIILTVCGFAYQFFFSSKVRPTVNRIVLLSILFIGMITPLISLIYIHAPQPEVESISIGKPILMNVYVVTSSSSSFTSRIREILPIFTYIYLGGICVMVVYTLISISRLWIIKKKSERRYINGVKVYVHNNKFLSTFSWLGYIFVYNKAPKEDLDALLIHELAHVRLCHWADIIFTQIVLILQWFNPMVWFLRKELHEMHEYQADQTVIQTGMDKYQYQILLLQNISNGRMPVFAEGIKSRSIKKRLTMMVKSDFKSNFLARSFSIGMGMVCGILLLQMPIVAEAVTQKEPVSKENIFILNKEANETVSYLIDDIEVSYDQINNLDSTLISCVKLFQNKNKVIDIITKEYDALENITTRIDERKIEMLPVSKNFINSTLNLQHLPSYEGGEEKLKRDLAMMVKWSSQKNRGTVKVGFTVTSEGGLDNFKIIKSLDSEQDVIAVNAIKSLSGRWLPGIIGGKPVDVEMALPITF